MEVDELEYILTEKQKKIIERVEKVAKKFRDRAFEIDMKRKFPFQNIKELKEIGYNKLTLPQSFGGEGEGLLTFLYCQEVIAKYCGSTALAIGWHNMTVFELSKSGLWDPSILAPLFKEMNDGKLINRAATEKATGSPTRGGVPRTTAVRNGNHWTLNGRKTYTSLAPVLDIILVSAWVPEDECVGWFIVHKNLPGVKIEETWDMIAMQGTGSHDLILDHVQVNSEDYAEKSTRKTPNGALLHIPACYIGIAHAARDYCIAYTKSYTPNSLTVPISQLPHIQAKMGEMELELLESRYFLYSVALKWETNPDLRDHMAKELGAVKISIMNHAMSIVDKAMRIVGAQSLARENPLSRYYCDIRAGLHNPPMEDATIQLLAKSALEE